MTRDGVNEAGKSICTLLYYDIVACEKTILTWKVVVEQKQSGAFVERYVGSSCRRRDCVGDRGYIQSESGL